MTRSRRHILLASTFVIASPVSAAGDPEKGAQAYRVCAGCHSLEPGRHLSGPSLARVYGRKAGTVEGFVQYSKALKQSKIVWNEKTLDAWIKKPDALIPGNLMPFPGIPDPNARADLVAFLKTAGGTAPGRSRSSRFSTKRLQPTLWEPYLLFPSNYATMAVTFDIDTVDRGAGHSVLRLYSGIWKEEYE